MADQTGVRGIVDRMALIASGALVTGAVPITASGVVEVRTPIAGGMALRAIGTHPGVGGRQGVTGNASR